MNMMLGEVNREEGTKEAIGAHAGGMVTISRGYNGDIRSFSKYHYSIMAFDVEAQALTMCSDLVFFINC